MKFSYEELKRILTDENLWRASRRLGRIARPIEVIDWWIRDRVRHIASSEGVSADKLGELDAQINPNGGA